MKEGEAKNEYTIGRSCSKEVGKDASMNAWSLCERNDVAKESLENKKKLGRVGDACESRTATTSLEVPN